MENRRLTNLGGILGLYVSGIRILGFLVLLVCGAGCSKNSEKPSGILSEQEMVKILMEIYINEERVNRLALRQDSASAVFRVFEKRVYDTAGISDTVFQKSMDYYFSRPQELQQIYTAVVDSLQLREQRAPFSTNE